MPGSSTAVIIFSICSVASLLLVLYVFLIISKIRKESKQSVELAAKSRDEWQDFQSRQDLALEDARQKLTTDLHRLSDRTREKISEFEENVGATQDHLERLESYLREFFEVEMKNIFDSFDSTVTTVLGHMREELVRGLKNIDEIQSVVESRGHAQDQILEGAFTVEGLLEGKEPPEKEEEEQEEEKEESYVEPFEDSEPEDDTDAVPLDTEETEEERRQEVYPEKE